MQKLFLINRPERKFLILGIISAALNGTCFPIVAFCLAKMIVVLFDPLSSTYRFESDMYSLAFVYIGVLSFVATMCQFYFFSLVGEGLTLKLRRITFEKMLRMPISWFDIAKNRFIFL